LLSALGAGIATLGGVSLASTGANRNVSAVGIPLLVSGVGIFGISWIADLYGSATGGTNAGPPEPTPVSLSLGYGRVDDPQFLYEHFAVLSAAFQFGRFQLEPSLWAALGADNDRSRVAGSYSLWKTGLGTEVKLQVAGTLHNFSDEGFATRTAESSLAGRWNLGSLGPRLAGSFAVLSAGVGYESIDLQMAGTTTGSSLLLGRAGFGAFLPGGGEAEFHYDHRRDTFAGGLTPSRRRGSGFAGSVGVSLRQPLGRRFAFKLASELGSAWVVSSGLEVRWGATQ